MSSLKLNQLFLTEQLLSIEILIINEGIINFSTIPRFLLEFQICFTLHLQKSSCTASWFNNRICNAAANRGKRNLLT